MIFSNNQLTRRSKTRLLHLFGILKLSVKMGDATNERCVSRNVCVCCCCCGSTTNELRHGVHRGYSSINSQIKRDASVPPTVIKVRSPYKNRTLPNGPEYTFASLYSLRLLMQGYLKSDWKIIG